ncbi:MAG TPA: F0F1 ATP synthase subunit delta [Chitinophagaceae bacterium]|nr:F0F1 ATP synthase subunit delta [Chitinophagaceae bacterium]
MQVDWFTVIAQIINFLILAWLLKRFLYKPVLDAIDARDKKIAAQIQEAERKMNEASKERTEFVQKNEAFEKQRNDKLAEIANDAETSRQKLLNDARSEAIALRVKLQESLQSEQQNINAELRQQMQEEAFAIAAKTLHDLASVRLEAEVVNIFIAKLNNLSAGEKEQFWTSLQSAGTIAVVKTAFELPAMLRNNIEQAINKISNTTVHLQFETAPGIISGIEISTGDYKLSWSISDYLDSMQKNIDSLLFNQ